ncbi:MAG: anion permease [Candidatus Methanofastidiosia archaeon]
MKILTIFAGIFVAFNIGANDAANAMGAAYGARLLTFKRASIVVALFALLGALHQGERVMKTLGEGILPPPQMSYVMILSLLMGAGVWVGLATYKGLPVSTTHAIMGALVSLGVFENSQVNWILTLRIVLVWILLPLMSGALVLLFSKFLSLTLSFVGDIYLFERLLGYLVVGSGCYVAYSLGANNVSNAVGVLVGIDILKPKMAALLGGVGIGLGALLYGRKVMFTVGRSIALLDPLTAFIAQISAASALIVCTFLAIPASLSQAMVGAIVGVGVLKGTRTIQSGILLRIFSGWVLTPIASGVLGVLIFLGLS